MRERYFVSHGPVEVSHVAFGCNDAQAWVLSQRFLSFDVDAEANLVPANPAWCGFGEWLGTSHSIFSQDMSRVAIRQDDRSVRIFNPVRNSNGDNAALALSIRAVCLPGFTTSFFLSDTSFCRARIRCALRGAMFSLFTTR